MSSYSLRDIGIDGPFYYFNNNMVYITVMIQVENMSKFGRSSRVSYGDSF